MLPPLFGWSVVRDAPLVIRVVQREERVELIEAPRHPLAKPGFIHEDAALDWVDASGCHHHPG
jgi:hypothetical protein